MRNSTPTRVTIAETKSSSKAAEDVTSDELLRYLNESKPARAAPATPVRSSSKTSVPSHLVGGAETSEEQNAGAAAELEDHDAIPTDPAALSARCMQLTEENGLLLREVTSLTDEVRSFSTRARASQDSLADMREALAASERKLARTMAAQRDLTKSERELTSQIEEKDAMLVSIRDRMLAAETTSAALEKAQADMSASHDGETETLKRQLDALAVELEAARKAGSTGHVELELEKHHVEEQLEALRQDLAVAKAAVVAAEDASSAAKASCEHQASLLRASQADIMALKHEHTEYKTRATAVLQSKEAVIAELQGSDGASVRGSVKAVSTTLNAAAMSANVAQLQSEQNALQKELMDAKALVEELRTDLADQDQQMHEESEAAAAQVRDLEAALREEKKTGADARREYERESEEARQLLADAIRRRDAASSGFDAKQAEAEQLKFELMQSQSLASASGSAELEARMRKLTDDILGKQSRIESLSADKTSLQLQLETERRRRTETKIDMPPPARPALPGRQEQTVHFSSIMPLGGGEAPFSRKVLSAANELDAISIRLGVMLRRYPIVRIVGLVYVALLHLWVLFVFMTFSPEIHAGDFEAHHPQHPDHIILPAA